ncbi:hypothetical protein MKX03_009410 [Papaver bracteatum]|nr:hypothetical protein MKX03_009410 [Papaver bracteatum]
MESSTSSKTRTKTHKGKPSEDILPGNLLNCRRIKDGNFHLAKIIQKRNLIGGGVGDFEYYVNYIDLNRRNDEWVKFERFDLKSLKPDIEPVEPEELAGVRTVECIELRRHEIKTWYSSPIPLEFEDCRRLHVCEFCFTFKNSRSQLKKHKKDCQIRDPPGHEIYRDGNLSVFQIDGATNTEYCDNLCYLAKMFLDIKGNLGRTENKMFYVLIVHDDLGYDMVAYFSKVKLVMESYNVSRILTLPPYQRRGYGTFLIGLAHEVAKWEKVKMGGVKSQLSDLALSCYRKYWNRVLLRVLKQHKGGPLSILDLSEKTAIHPEDVTATLKQLNLLELDRENRRYNVITDAARLARHDIYSTETEIVDFPDYTKNLDSYFDPCPDFDAAKMITWLHPQTEEEED